MTMHERGMQPAAMAGEKWYAVRVAFGGEFRANREIEEELGFESYCPRHKVHVMVRGKRRQRIRALTPNYIFVRCQMNHIFMHAILERKHVSDIIRGCGSWEPQFIPDWAIATLKDYEAGKELDDARLERMKGVFAIGDKVILMEGVLRGQQVVVTKLDGKRKLKVHSDLHGAGRPLTVLRSAVERVSD